MFNKKKYPYVYKGHQYALDIVSGKVPANVWVIASCQRYLNDLDRIKTDPECPFYFLPEKAEKFLRITQKFEHAVGSWDSKRIIFEPWQCFAWMCIKGFYAHYSNEVRFRTIHLDMARGNAKSECLQTLIPTPQGLRKLGELKIGDQVYARDGSVCNIINETEVHLPKTYCLTFDRNKKVYASDEHLWFTKSVAQRKREKRHISRGDSKENLNKAYKRDERYESVSTSEEISKNVKVRGESNHAVTLTTPVEGVANTLLVDPYLLGYWLGDGHKGNGRVTGSFSDLSHLTTEANNTGFKCSEIIKDKRKEDCGRVNIYDMLPLLRNIGVLGNKHIPNTYLNATVEDRISLLQGLFDSDGTIHRKTGQIIFSTVTEELAKHVTYLVSSLGFKCNYSEDKIVSNFHTANEFYYRVSFTPITDIDLFRLPRKKERQRRVKSSFTQNDYIYITKVEEAETRPMKCIQVDSVDGSYLCTEFCIPTHNSTMASQACLYDLCCDNPNGNRIYCAATSRQQAGEVLEGSRIMARKSNSFLKNFGAEVRANEILHSESNSFVKSISAQANNADGKIGKTIITDELHAMSRKLFETLISGQSKRKDSQIISITTAGYANDGIGASQRAYAKKVSLADIEDDTFFAMVYCIEPDDDPFDPDVWVKANPNLGVSVDPVNFKAQAEKAKINPEDKAGFMIKHLNLYLDSANQFFEVQKWKQCRNEKLKFDDFEGEKCHVGIDLASKVDITSICFMFKRGDKFIPFWKNFVPEERIKSPSRQNYARYIKEGDLIATPGEAINLIKIYEYLIKDLEKFNVLSIAADPWNATEMINKLSMARFNVLEFRMNTANLSESMKKLDAEIREQNVEHNSGKMLEWCLGNVVAKRDHNDNVFPRKDHESLKIDPIVAALMPMAAYINDEQKESVYEQRDLIVL